MVVIAAAVAAAVAFRYREGFAQAVAQPAPGTPPTIASSRPNRPLPPPKDSDEVLDEGIRALRTLVKQPPPPPGVRVTVPVAPRLAIPYLPELHREGRCDDIGAGVGVGGTCT